MGRVLQSVKLVNFYDRFAELGAMSILNFMTAMNIGHLKLVRMLCKCSDETLILLHTKKCNSIASIQILNDSTNFAGLIYNNLIGMLNSQYFAC